MTFKIQSMEAFDELFAEAEPVADTPPEAAAEPEEASKPARSYSAENPAVPSHIEKPVALGDVAAMLERLGQDLASFRIANYPEVVVEYSERYKLHEAWDWDVALKASTEPKLAALAVLQVRYERGLFDGVARH